MRIRHCVERADMPVSLDRRSLVAGAAGAVGVAALGGLSRALGSPSDLLRPPGGQDETAFVAKCLKCDRCQSVCEPDCIGLARIEQGLVNVRTPYLNFRKGFCTFCNRCIEVCPTGALVPFDPSVERVGVAVVDEGECLAWGDGGCEKCAEACEYGAISLDDMRRPVVNEGLCNGCGKCEHVCPSASLRSYSGSKMRGVNVRAASSTEEVRRG